jgi:ABC-type transport system involved in multi-copper enzyme maturation permease subunit
LWKEWRLQRLVLVTGLCLFLLPYTFPLVWILRDPTTTYMTALAVQSSIILSILTLALLGGNAIASERADRSAEFMAYQPVSRGTIILGKLAWPAIAATVLWGANLLVFVTRNDPYPLERTESLRWMLMFVAMGCCAFSVAWLVSAWQASPTFAAGAGMAAPLALLLLLALIYWAAGGLLAGIAFDGVWLCLNLLAAIVCAVAGTLYYLRRVEP